MRLTTQVLIRRHRPDDQLDRLTGRRVKITVDHPDHYQMDGDTVGECTTLVAEVQPGALLLRVPRLRREITAGTSAMARRSINERYVALPYHGFLLRRTRPVL